MMNQKNVFCFGEILWDLLPSGKIAGGAPLNVATQLKNLGVQSHMISAVGNDELGTELLNFIKKKQINTSLVSSLEKAKTSTVEVKLNNKGIPSYNINENVAWDQIILKPSQINEIKKADALVYGTLSCRNATTRNTLFNLLTLPILKVMDLNLRTPYYEKALISKLLPATQILKLNEEELDILSTFFKLQGNEIEQCKEIIATFQLEKVILTKGTEGSILVDNKHVFHQNIYPITVEDTVGSGDAFLAAFITSTLNNKTPQECLSYASAAGAVIASKKGGTAELNNFELEAIINK